ncbi:MAG: metal-dependent transcriptional regulator [Gemmatimonadota bacterium]|nr:metal-dependent transcriptional regulator [Gemmatimonadota bacterium]MDE3174006.1 metal-dependent transcriptional regulator [Gemmatimonadota bacterium]MDE3217645.1 metal-dependent transcriptional regulator [Gemmatimonadota bacterium]
MTPARSAPASPLTAPVEDYLKAIYELERSGNAAGTNEIAAALRIAPASASGMVRRLADQGLIVHTRYRGARLTDAGRAAALRTIRRHRVIEAYLARALDYPWDRVHDEAERLEHAASDELVNRMAAAIGEPATDPHGAPIPARDGSMDERRLVSLDDIAEGAEVRVQRVEDDDPGRLRYLGGLGIRPGARVQVALRAPFGGPITLRIGRVRQQIGPDLARHVLVTPPAALALKHAGTARRPARAPGRRRGRSADDRD